MAHSSTDARRILRLGGVRNLRDVGGYPTRDARRTRWAALYRSDCLDELDPRGQVWLVRAGLRSIIDLRGQEEIADRPNVFATSSDIAYRHFPLFTSPPPDDFGPDLHEGYRLELDVLGERLVELLRQLIRPGTLPALVHCASGKDRTGVTIAVILAAIGVEPRTIAEDYALSQACLGPHYLAETRAWVEERGWDWSVWEHTAHTPPERMLKTLAYLDDRYGGVERYLLDHGLAPAELAMLRDVLTEPS